MAETQEIGQTQAGTAEFSDFGALLNKEFRPKSEHAQEAIQNAVKTLAAQALESSVVVSNDVVNTINAIIAELDRKLTEQINQIIHHADYQKLEGAWRGLAISSTIPRPTRC
jgi:type VI secretion system protein ImpC